jgi:opacity protein-like surface antigen
MNRISITLLAGVALLSTATAGRAADLLAGSPATTYGGYTSPAGGWDGTYVGGFVGYGWGTVVDEGGTIGLADDELGLSGMTIGATLGANFTVAPGIVLGAAGDLAWADIGGYDNDNSTDLSHDINWSGSVRGRAGFDGGAFMPYLTAGLAVAGATADIGPDRASAMHFGWTAGLGVEVAATEQISVDLQYRYSDYGNATYDLSSDVDMSLSSHTLSAGVNFKF